MICAGHYQYPGRAAREAARLTLGESGSFIMLHLESGNRSFSLDQLTVSDALGSIPLTITFPDGARFVPEDDASFRGWYFSRSKPTLVHRLERRKRGMLLALCGTICLGFFYVFILLPWLSVRIAYHIPVQAEQRLGEYTLKYLVEAESFKESALPPARQQELQALFAGAIPPSMRHEDPPLKLKLMRFPGGANAFMLADGTLIVSDELVKMAKSDDAIVAVMLHEMGHHHYRHPMRMVVRSSIVTMAVMWMTGDVSGIGDTLLQSAAFLDQMQYSRGMEREADTFAIAEMRRQNRPLAAMGQMFRALRNDSGDEGKKRLDIPDWLSTHPAMDERLERIDAAAQGEAL